MQPKQTSELERVLAGAQLLALDVDGTLTDGGVAFVGKQELQRFNVHERYLQCKRLRQRWQRS